MPLRQLRLVQAWIEIHRDELMADWALGSHSPHLFAHSANYAIRNTMAASHDVFGNGKAAHRPPVSKPLPS